MTPTLIKTYFPEFASLDDAFIQLYIDSASLSVNVNRWGNKSEWGIAYLTAHLLTLLNRGGNGQSGPVTQEKVGDLSRTYAPTSAISNSDYASTSYGQEFLRLRKSIFSTIMVL